MRHYDNTLQSSYSGKMLDCIRNKASVQTLDDGLTWYEKASDDIQRLAGKHGLPFNIVAGIVAALSPGCRWTLNLESAESIILGNGQRHFTYSYANVLKAETILAERDTSVLSGLKVVPFYATLVNHNHGLPVIDVWMQRFFGLPKKLKVNQRYNLILAFQDVAYKLGLLVSQVQAIIWIYAKSEGENIPWEISI